MCQNINLYTVQGIALKVKIGKGKIFISILETKLSNCLSFNSLWEEKEQ